MCVGFRYIVIFVDHRPESGCIDPEREVCGLSRGRGVVL